jgi:hypothetical protein
MQNSKFDNIEIGAGCGNFGKIFYPVILAPNNTGQQIVRFIRM